MAQGNVKALHLLVEDDCAKAVGMRDYSQD